MPFVAGFVRRGASCVYRCERQGEGTEATEGGEISRSCKNSRYVHTRCLRFSRGFFALFGWFKKESYFLRFRLPLLLLIQKRGTVEIHGRGLCVESTLC